MRICLRIITGTLAALMLCALVVSCAYFNTLYNARRLYTEAEERRENEGPERELRDRYGQVVEKCAKVVRDYPDSKWVDDALFLMGKALVRQGEVDKGIRKFVEITTNFPESDYVPPSFYWLGLAHWEKGDDNQALVYAERFLGAYPDHDLRYDVMFLAGDIKREMGLDEEALALYARVADEASDRDVIDAATLRTAELFFVQGDYDKAATAYETLLRKGISWETRYEISRSLGDCYTRIGRCEEALELFDRLGEESTTTKEKPPLELGRAASYVCMDSLEAAIGIYEGITKEFPKSKFSAEAFYEMGVIYHEKLDSLSNAQAAFSKVAGEYANSEFASDAIQKSTSLKRLMELSETGPGVGGSEQLAEKRFLAAEIQLTRLGEVDIALANYEAIVDSFPESSYAPRAAFAVAWINDWERQDRERAVELYRRVVSLYPGSMQAVGAVDRIGSLGAQELREQLQALVDSAAAEAELAAVDSASTDTTYSVPPVDTLGAGRPRRTRPARPKGSAETVPADTLAVPRIAPAIDSTAAPRDTIPAGADSTAAEETRPVGGGKEGAD